MIQTENNAPNSEGKDMEIENEADDAPKIRKTLKVYSEEVKK